MNDNEFEFGVSMLVQLAEFSVVLVLMVFLYRLWF